MPLSVRNMIAIVVTLVILLGVFFTVALYYPVKKRAQRVGRSRALLEAQVEALSPPGGGKGSQGTIRAAMAMDVNYFKMRNISPRTGIPELLKQIDRLGSRMNVRFMAVRPLEEEDAPGYRRYPFRIEARAGYAELVNFVNQIENGLRLSLSDLNIEAEKKSSSMHRLEFTLNIYELKDDLPVQEELEVKRSLPPGGINLVAVARDPFSSVKRPKPVRTAQKPKAARGSTKRTRRPKLVLMGIMDIAGSKRAIINNRVFRQGERIRGQRIKKIADDHVVIGKGGRTYSLYLRGTSGLPERGEVKQ